MKLVEALEINRDHVADGAPSLILGLACGFTPLHLTTFLEAEIRRRPPAATPSIVTGLYDDLVGNVVRLAADPCDVLVVVIEWSDLDPRLGLRRLGGWRVDDLDDIVDSARGLLDRLRASIAEAATHVRVVCSLPTLPLPPVFSTRLAESGRHELRLSAQLATFAAELSEIPSVHVVSAQEIDAQHLSDIRDPKAELGTGFPYSLGHASAVADSIAALIVPPPPRKGLITDLDGTLWDGLVGEIGAENISFDLDSGAQVHGLYQQLLDSLASAGVLLAVASKNDAEVVAQAFERSDIIVRPDAIFPFEVGWGPKSAAVRSILDIWNLDPSDVVFVDDSPLELAEVAEAFPQLETIPFPAGAADAWHFLRHLRDLFGRNVVTAEDRLRIASIKSGASLRSAAASSPESLEDFLARAEGRIVFKCGVRADQRALDLINKTNQFNMNGRRLDAPALERLLAEPGGFLLTVAYEDRFGPLGTIAVVVGRADGPDCVLDHWVMSCRAFSRRIEFQTLDHLFGSLGARDLVLTYERTERNGPFKEFIASLGVDPDEEPSHQRLPAALAGTQVPVHSVAVAE